MLAARRDRASLWSTTACVISHMSRTFDDLLPAAIGERVPASVGDRVLLELHHELGCARPGVRPTVNEAIERMIGRALLAAILTAFVEHARQGTKRLASNLDTGKDRDAF